MYKQFLNHAPVASALLCGLAMTISSASAGELENLKPSGSDLLRAVEHSIAMQTREMLQNAALDLELEIRAGLASDWSQLGGAELADLPPQQKALVAVKE